ncbi:MAG: T9SS type A sorting domain-containing protein [Bacteroidota bacterium]|nr:T9SS type A sorting domain-containing protein [Bacteroidota bacterium]
MNNFSNSFARIYVTGNQVNIINNTTDQLEGKLMIYSMQGQLVYERSVHLDRSRKIPVYLENGCYILQFIAESGICSTKACL